MNKIKTSNPAERAMSRIEDLWSEKLWGDSSFGAIDVEERDDEVCISADLPGVDSSDIDLHIERGILEIVALRKEERKGQGGGLFHAERNWGKIKRSLRLPEVDPDSAEANLENGVLEVKLKKAKDSGSKIVIQTKS